MISFIIPCLNHFEMTNLCLQYLLRFTDMTDSELIVIDDGSDDETQAIERMLKEPYTVIRHSTHHGFGPSVNDGLKIAQGEHVAIFNNDFLVGPNWLPPLLRALEDSLFGIATGTLFEPVNCTDVEFLEYIKNKPRDFTILDWHKGGPWLARRQAIEEVGLIDERFEYAQYEDVDWLLRFAFARWKFGMVQNSHCYHYSAVTQNGELKKRVGDAHILRNRERFIDKWGGIHVNFEKAYRGEKGAVT